MISAHIIFYFKIFKIFLKLIPKIELELIINHIKKSFCLKLIKIILDYYLKLMNFNVFRKDKFDFKK